MPVSRTRPVRTRSWGVTGSQPSGPAADIVAGAPPLGVGSYAIPGSGTVKYVSPTGSNANPGTFGSPYLTVQFAINQIATSGTVVIRAGTYYEQLTVSSSRMITLQPYTHEVVWFDGSATYSSWTNNGDGTWTSTYTLNHARVDVSSFPGTDAFRGYTDQVWVDDVALTQIADSSIPAANQFSVNQTANTIRIGINPTGKTVRIAELNNFLIASGVSNLKGIGIRRYSPQTIEGHSALAYYGTNSHGSVIEDCVWAGSSFAGLGVSTVNDVIVRSCTFQDMGLQGIGGTQCHRILIDKVVVRRTNFGLFAQAPTNGAIKLTKADAPIVRWSWFEDCPLANIVWFDQSCLRTQVYGCYVDGRTKGRGIATRCIYNEICDGGFISGVQYHNYFVGNSTIGGIFALASHGSGYSEWWNNSTSLYQTAGVQFWQDRSYPGSTGDTGPPWPVGTNPMVLEHAQLINTNIDYSNAGAGFQLLAYTNYTGGVSETLGWNIFDLIEGNWFRPAGGALGNMSQLGKIDGTRNSYNTLAALAASGADVAGPPGAKLGTNYQGTTTPDASVYARAVPSNIATLLGVDAGTKMIGPNSNNLPTLMVGTGT